jgi:arylsulfatase A-like enzyme
MRYPGVIKPGTKINEMVVNIDLAPSLLGFTNSPIPTDIQGKNMATLFTKKPLIKPWRKSIYYHYYEYPQPHQVAPHFGVRTEKYKLIRFYGPHNDWELFDLTNDKTEMHNLISDNKYQPIVLQLKKELKDLIVQFKDTEAITILESQQ